MQPPNATWQQIIAQATQSPDILKAPEVCVFAHLQASRECAEIAVSAGTPAAHAPA